MNLRLLSGLLFCLILCAATGVRAERPSVVLLTLDGVRWQELLKGTDPELGDGRVEPVFSRFHDTLRAQGVFFPDARLSNAVAISLPAYASILSGRFSDCEGNGCGRIRVPTLPEHLRATGRYSPTDLALFASWEKLPLAAERTPGHLVVNAAGDRFGGDHADLDAAQAADPAPWEGARLDRYTMAHGLRYLRAHHPRLLVLSLNDADEQAHRGDYPAYIEALRAYDRAIAEVVLTLEEMGEDGRQTTLLVTTDHGRGRRGGWRDHGHNPDSERVWVYARRTGASPGPAITGVAHADLAPTIAEILGEALPPCDTCGRAIPEIVALGRAATRPTLAVRRGASALDSGPVGHAERGGVDRVERPDAIGSPGPRAIDGRVAVGPAGLVDDAARGIGE
jgi:hypothetical protein